MFRFKKVFLLIFAISFTTAQDSPFTGTWKLAPSAGAMKVGPNVNDGSWWSSSGADVETRACLFDDEYIFSEDGTFQNILQDTTWLEDWQGVTGEQCGAPVAPHDGSNPATWYYDETAQTITLSGVGAYLGLAKAIDGAEMNTCGCEVPETRTYNVLSAENGVMIVYISQGGGYWTFTFAQEGVELETNVTFIVDMSLEETHPQGVYLAGGDIGQEGYLMNDSDGDDVWVTTIPLMIGSTVKYKFRNQPSFGTWNGFEPTAGLVAGDCATGQYNDRYLTVPDVATVLDTVCYAACVGCETLNFVNVTFSVNMSDIDTDPAGPTLSGDSFPPPGIAMLDPDGDDVWTATVEQAPGALVRYKFSNGSVDANWGANWEDVPSNCQSEDPDNTDRSVLVGENDTVVDTVCFSSCENCITNYPVDVTFNLDMSTAEGFDGSQQPYVFGSYNNWDNFTSPTMLSDNDADNIFTGTVSNLMYNDSITFLFGYGQNFESVTDECGIYDNDLMINVRPLPIRNADGDSVLTLPTYSYGGCPPDSTPRAFFRVDVSSVMGSWPAGFNICVTGSFDGWSGCGTPLADPDGDNIYTGIVTDLQDSTDYEYKFLVNNQWGDTTFESAPPLGSSCDFNSTDSYNNYGFTALSGPEPMDLGLHPWNECPSLSNDDKTTGLLPTSFSYKAYPNPFNPFINISYSLPKTEQVELSIINLLGQKIKTLTNTTQNAGEYYFTWDGKDINGSTMNSGIYFAVISRESGRDVLKITFLK